MEERASMKIFLSCVSTEFKSYRLKLANQLGALKGHPYEVKVQEDFQQGGHILLESLADYVRKCDLVIHLVGEASGARPTQEHEQSLLQTLGKTDSATFSGWSYTQWEYRLARYFKKEVLVYFAKPEAPRDFGWPIRQSDDDARLQQAHVQHIYDSGEHRTNFDGWHQLVREVFHDLCLELNHKVNNLPYKTLGTLFKGREGFLEKIHTMLSQAEYCGHQRVAAITASATVASVHGLGGIGKTRVALEFAHKHFEDYTALLFVRADSPDGLKANLGALCRPSVLDLEEKDTKELDVQVAATLHWLQQHPGWLLILDNVDTEQAAQAVENILGQLSSAGQVLITSRISRWSGAVESLALDVLTEADAESFLLERTANRRRKQADDASQAHKLAVTLGKLALALEQAGAMIETKRMSFAQYLEQWQTQHDRVLMWFNERLMQYPLSVAVTWQTSFDQLSEPARRLLNRLAWFSPDPIPETLLDVTIEVSSLDDSGKYGISELPTELFDALADLETFSLVTRADDVPTFSVHRLVQDVTRRSLQGDGEHHELTGAMDWIDKAFVGDPEDVRSWSTLDPLAPHAQTCVHFADKAQINEPTNRLMNQLGTFFYSKALYAQAEPLMRRALAIDEQSYEENNPKVAIRLSNLAQLLRATNRLKEAEPLMRQALAIDEQYYGENHPKVAVDLTCLAGMFLDTNRLKEAEQLLRRALAIDEQGLGENHPSVAIVLSNLAGLLKATNRLKDAEQLIHRALAIDEQRYGENHPKVANHFNNLAQLLQDTNRLMEAEQLMRRALAINKQYYGENHPTVAIHINNLAALLLATNRVQEAEPLMRQALVIDEQSLGENHPDVAIRLNNLATLLKATNGVQEAELLMRRALAIDEQSLGENHPAVATDINNLATLLQATNRIQEAELLMRRMVGILLNFSLCNGHPHPYQQASLNNYIQLLLQMGLSREHANATIHELIQFDNL